MIRMRAALALARDPLTARRDEAVLMIPLIPKVVLLSFFYLYNKL